MPSSLTLLQEQIKAWQERIFPDETAEDMLIGAMEELGELAHNHRRIKWGQANSVDIKDAVGDTIIYLINYCNKKDICFEDALINTWKEVSQRTYGKEI